MTQTTQTNFQPGTGDCWAACIAAVLDLPLSEVPNFCGVPPYNPDWFTQTDAWLQKRGLRCVSFEMKAQDGNTPVNISCPNGAPLLCTGKSPRGDWLHVVVMTVKGEEFALLNDPHPSGIGLDGPFTDVALIVKA